MVAAFAFVLCGRTNGQGDKETECASPSPIRAAESVPSPCHISLSRSSLQRKKPAQVLACGSPMASCKNIPAGCAWPAAPEQDRAAPCSWFFCRNPQRWPQPKPPDCETAPSARFPLARTALSESTSSKCQHVLNPVLKKRSRLQPPSCAC